MSLELALRATEVLLAVALLQQSAEHLVGPRGEALLFGARAMLCLLLLSGIATSAVLIALVVVNLAVLVRFQGPYNGGSDRMGGLILICLAAVHWVPAGIWQERVFGYLAVQLILSYVISGKVKLCNPDWRNGRALADVFAFSAYPVSEALRRLSDRHALLISASWSVILFELLFPLALVSQALLIGALLIGAGFHLANACLFGLNRFFWTWLAAYPSLLWLQWRVLG